MLSNRSLYNFLSITLHRASKKLFLVWFQAICINWVAVVVSEGFRAQFERQQNYLGCLRLSHIYPAVLADWLEPNLSLTHAVMSVVTISLDWPPVNWCHPHFSMSSGYFGTVVLSTAELQFVNLRWTRAFLEWIAVLMNVTKFNLVCFKKRDFLYINNWDVRLIFQEEQCYSRVEYV